MEYLKKYKIKLTTLGPVYIGSGETISKVDYVIKGNNVSIPDIDKMYKWIIDNGYLDSYVESRKNRKRLSYWLRENNIENNYKEWEQYNIALTQQEKEQFSDLNMFIRDAFNAPYIPGSSLKGSLRTIITAGLLNNSLLNERQKLVRSLNEAVREYRPKTKGLLRETDIIINKLMRGIRISDSKPLTNNELFISNKIDLKMDKSRNILPIYREYLKPLTEVEFTMTIDKSIADIEDYGIEDKLIIDFTEEFYKNYEKIVLKKFNIAENIDKNVMYIGGGAGFFAKTLEYSLLGEEAVDIVSRIIHKDVNNTRMKSIMNHKDDKREAGISPRVLKMTRYNNKMYEIGKCKIEFK